MNDKDLNYLSATEIMGWRLDSTKNYWVYYDSEEGIIHNPESVNSWTPLTDMNQCMMVVEKMVEKTGYYFSLNYGWLGHPSQKLYQASFENLDCIIPTTSQPIKWFARDKEKGFVILTAALRAKGVLEG